MESFGGCGYSRVDIGSLASRDGAIDHSGAWVYIVDGFGRMRLNKFSVDVV